MLIGAIIFPTLIGQTVVGQMELGLTHFWDPPPKTKEDVHHPIWKNPCGYGVPFSGADITPEPVFIDAFRIQLKLTIAQVERERFDTRFYQVCGVFESFAL